MPCYAINGVAPVVSPQAYVHPDAVLIGDVLIGAGAYVGPCASLRGDFGRLVIEQGANVQDCCVMHGYPGTDTTVARDAHVGHGAVVHGATVEPNALIGIGSILLDGCTIGTGAVIAAGAVVPSGCTIAPGMLAMGVPATVKRAANEHDLRWKNEATAAYQDLARRSLATMQPVSPLTEPEDGRKRIEEVLPELAAIRPHGA